MASKSCGWAIVVGFAVGVIASATASWIASSRGRKQHQRAAKRPIGPVVKSSGDGQSLYEPLTRTYVPIRDRRAEFRNVPASEEEVRLFLARRRGLRPRALKRL